MWGACARAGRAKIQVAAAGLVQRLDAPGVAYILAVRDEIGRKALFKKLHPKRPALVVSDREIPVHQKSLLG